MSKRYEENYEIPDDLKKHFTKIYSNRRPDEGLTVNPKVIITIFKSELETFINELATERSKKNFVSTKKKKK